MVKVTILDKDKDLKPEMSARVTFLEKARRPPPTGAPCAQKRVRRRRRRPS